MLVHECMACFTLSINRIAADDDSDSIISVFQNSLIHGSQQHDWCRQQGIEMLGLAESELVYEQLYGQKADLPITS